MRKSVNKVKKFNRKFIMECMEHQLSQALFILKRFKKINDDTVHAFILLELLLKVSDNLRENSAIKLKTRSKQFREE